MPENEKVYEINSMCTIWERVNYHNWVPCSTLNWDNIHIQSIDEILAVLQEELCDESVKIRQLA